MGGFLLMTKLKRTIVSWSSGKDATLTLERLNESPDYEVVGLYTTYVGNEVPFQATPLDVVQLQADLLGLPLIAIEMPEDFPPNEHYQQTIIKALHNSGLNIESVAFGDMFCTGIEEYRRGYIEPQGWECVFPLMGESSKDLANEILARGIQTMLVTIDGEALDPSWCGRWFTPGLLKQLPENVDPCGENGEFHTLVVSAPSFSGKIGIKITEVEVGARFSHQRYQVIKA